MKKEYLVHIILSLYLFFPFNFINGQVQLGSDITFSSDSRFGQSIAVSQNGNRFITGAPLFNLNNNGQIKVYEYQNSSWNQVSFTISGSSDGANIGHSVAMSGDGNRIAFGEINGIGQVKIFDLIDDAWTELESNITGSLQGTAFGETLAMSADGSRLIVGAKYNGDNGFQAGQVKIFEQLNENWQQLGQNLNGENNGDWSGSSLAISSDGNRIAIGAPGYDGSSNFIGQVRIFEFTNDEWQQLGNGIEGENYMDQSGHAVSLSANGNIVAISAIGNDDNASASGHVRVFEWTGNIWTQLGNDIDGAYENAALGSSVSLSASGTSIAIGSSRNDTNGNNSGQAVVFDFENNEWVMRGEVINGQEQDNMNGASVALSSNGDRIFIGAPGTGSPGSGGYAWVFGYGLVNIGQPVKNDFFIFPNPSSNLINLPELDIDKIEIIDLIGNVYYNEKHPNRTINISSLPSGLYIIRSEINKKIIINQFVKE